MKKNLLMVVVPALLISLLGFSVFNDGTKSSTKAAIIKEIIFKGLISQAHYNDLTIDDDFSAKAFDNYLKKLDPSKRFFTRTDVAKLEKHKFQIDDELNGAMEMPLMEEATKILEARVAQVEVFTHEILASPFDFTKDESVELDADKRDFPANEAELKEAWRTYLKYRALIRFYSLIEDQKKSKETNPDFTPKTEEEIEENVRKELEKSHNSLFKRLSKMDEDDYLADYINALLAVFGPHTEYFPPQEKENFDIGMSGRVEGIGAQLSQIDSEIKVVSIVPGSPSWRQGDLKEEDIILKVAQGDDEPVSVLDMPLKDAVSLIRGKKGTEVRLTVKKPDGRIKQISIIRDVVILEESYAKSAVIEDQETKQKIGYIFLPSFYADFSGSGGRSSADDVRKEIEKLKQRNVSGIVLDLRFNGGGSLQDAVDMSGLFIKSGPIVQVRSKRGNPIILEDKNPDIAWEGPLAIMINEFSASASEILAAAMQDYGRAVVVGSDHSFGKGTVQRFVDLDLYLNSGSSHLRPLGSLKLTIQKFYRITGKSTQWKGVESDIVLPDVYSYLEVGEKELDFALPWDEIKSQNFSAWSASPDVARLRKTSQARTGTSPIFRKVEENAQRMKTQRERTLQTLNLADFSQQQAMLDKESEEFSNMSTKQTHLTIVPVDEIVPQTRLDSIRVEGLVKWKKELQENIYMSETMAIMNDLLKQKSIASSEKKK